MDIFNHLKGFHPINENVAVAEDVALLITGQDNTSPLRYLDYHDALDIVDKLNTLGDPELAASIRNFPAINNVPSPRFGIVIYSEKPPTELQRKLASIPSLNEYTLIVRHLATKPDMWTPYDTARAKETAERTNTQNELLKQKEQLGAVIKANKDSVADRVKIANDEFAALNNNSTVKDQIRVRDLAIFATTNIDQAVKGLTGLPGVEKSDLDEIQSSKPEMENIIKIINGNFKKKKEVILEHLSELERTSNVKNSDQINQELGDIGNDILMFNDGKAMGERDKEILRNAFNKVREKFKVDGKTIANSVSESKFTHLAKKYKLFQSKEYKSEFQLMQDYYKLQEELNPLKEINQEEYNKFYTGLEYQYLYKLGKLRSETKKKDFGTHAKPNEKKEQLNVNTYEKENGTLVTNKGAATESIVMDYGDGKTFTQYPIDVHLPLGKEIIVDNLQQIEGDNIKGNRSQNASKFFHILKRGIESLIGYEPQGGAAKAISAMKGANRLFGHVFGFGVSFAAGRTGGALRGSVEKAKGGSFKEGYGKGKEVGEKVGDFAKYEIINNPDEINPALAEFGEWINQKLKLKDEYYDNSTYFSGGGRGRFMASPKVIRESAGAVALDGGGMNVPGSIPGIGNPIPPTPNQTPFHDGVKTLASDSGSGDNFQPVRIKKRLKITNK